MEKLPNILHSYRLSSDAITFSALTEQRSSAGFVGNCFSLLGKSGLLRGKDIPADDSWYFFDADYCDATSLSTDLECICALEFQPEDCTFINPEPGPQDWEDCVSSSAYIWISPQQEGGSPSGRILCLDDGELPENFFTGMTRRDFAINRFSYFIIGSLVHLAALYMVLAIPHQSFRGFGGISDRPISVKLQTLLEAVAPDIPSPASVDSPASLASLARRDPQREEKKIQKELEKEQPTAPRMEEEANEIKREPSPMNEKHIDETVIAHQKALQEHSLKDDRPNNSESLHDSVHSTPSVAMLERKASPKAGDEAESYKDLILSAIHEAAYYPRAALKTKSHGQTVVCFTINKDGSLASVSIVTHADSEILDDAALMILKKASSHFPPIPEVLMKDQLTYVVPIVFKKRS
jgi:protein TonB